MSVGVRRLMNRRVLLTTWGTAGAALLATWGFLSRGHTRRERQRQRTAIAEMFGGGPALATVAKPSRVEAYRLDPLPAGRSWTEASVADYPVTAGPVAVPAAIVGPVSAALLSPDTYGWDFAKSCLPTYGVRLSFHRGGERIDVLFCFECNILLIGRDGRTTGGEDFDRNRAVFVRAARALFPEDDLIQRLR